MSSLLAKARKGLSSFISDSYLIEEDMVPEGLTEAELFDFDETLSARWQLLESSSSSEMSPSNSSPPSCFDLNTSTGNMPFPLDFDPTELLVDAINRGKNGATTGPSSGSNSTPIVKTESLSPPRPPKAPFVKCETPSLGRTTEEERQLKRQRRLIKNRESAQLSRLRKKMYIEDLEKKVSQLSSQNDVLTQQVNTISNEKKRLAEEVVYLQNIIKQSPHIMGQTPIHDHNKRKTNLKTAGVCLLMVLLSFGLLFNAAAKTRQEKITWNDKFKSEKLPQLEFNQKGSFTSAPLIQTISETPLQGSIEQKTKFPSIHGKRPRIKEEKEDKEEEVFVASSEEKAKAEDTKAQEPLQKRPRVASNELQQQTPKPPHELAISIPPSPVVESPAPAPLPQQVPATNSVPPSINSPRDEMIALLIPSRMLNSSLLAPHLQNSSTPSLAVMRQALNLYMWPMPNSM